MSAFMDAVRQLALVVCPHCHNADASLLERVGAVTVCAVCGKSFVEIPKA